MLAIIIPYYKRSFFEETLQSLVDQSDQRFKVFIGDDASPENPALLLEKYAGKFDFVYQRFESNLGSISLAQQWDRCISLSKEEEWLIILGDDDVLGNNVVEEFYKQLDNFNSKINVVRFSSGLINEEGNKISKIYTFSRIESAIDSFLNQFLELTRSSMSEYVFSRKSYNKSGFADYPLAWYTDDKAWLDFSKCKSIFSINEAVVYVRISSQNISGRIDNKQLKLMAGWQFYKDVVAQKFPYFNKEQKNIFLFRYGILQVEFSNIMFKQTFLIWIEFIKMGDFYNSFRYLRRIFKALKR